MKFPDDARQFLARRYRSRHREWLAGAEDDTQWPLEIPLGVPTERIAREQVDGVRLWVNAWQHWQGAGTLSWCERRWRTLGIQRLPERLVLHDPQEVATWIGESARWERALHRYRALVSRWPVLARHLPRYFDALADYDEADLHRLTEMLDWLSHNPASRLYPRQIPLAGIDSKWLDSRKGIVADLLAALQEDPAGDRNFYRRCGLRQQPQLIRMRILDPGLRARFGGLGDISAPCEDLARLDIRPACVFVVENLQTGLAFEDLAGSVVIMGLGYAVDLLGQLPWLRNALCLYWGDIDTHGFAILNRARSYVPHMGSMLMDESTLINHRDLWIEEREQHQATWLPMLIGREQKLFQQLRHDAFGHHVRLEQERIRWDMAWASVSSVVR